VSGGCLLERVYIRNGMVDVRLWHSVGRFSFVYVEHEHLIEDGS
jgi:glutathionyl-hydroquinone reductase